MKSCEFVFTETKDALKLPGCLWEAKQKDVCVLCVHGMSGNILENYFGIVLGRHLSKNGISFIFSHNRGYNHINDIKLNRKNKDGSWQCKRFGAAYERFFHSERDIDAWVEEAERIGFQKIILLGHSLGCNKVINYFAKAAPEDVEAVILASPPDMVGLAKLTKYQSNYDELLEEAQSNLAKGEGRKVLTSNLWNWYNLSSQTFVDLCTGGGPADNFPLLRNPEHFEQLESVNVPVLAFMGEHDDIEIRTIEEDLNLIEAKAVNCPAFSKSVVAGANHTYDDREEDVASLILEWVRNL